MNNSPMSKNEEWMEEKEKDQSNADWSQKWVSFKIVFLHYLHEDDHRASVWRLWGNLSSCLCLTTGICFRVKNVEVVLGDWMSRNEIENQIDRLTMYDRVE